MGSKRSKHNTDHALHKNDYSNLCSKLHREFSDTAILNDCSFKFCDFSDLQEPDLPKFQSVSTTEEPAEALDEEEDDQY